MNKIVKETAKETAKVAANSTPANVIAIGIAAVFLIGAGALGYMAGYSMCEKNFKPAVESLEKRIMKLEKRASL